jgi:hypothetical protein
MWRFQVAPEIFVLSPLLFEQRICSVRAGA